MLCLLIQTFFSGVPGRPGGLSLFPGDHCCFDERLQPADGIFSVFFLASELLGLDDNNAVLCDPLVIEGQ